MMLFYFYLLNGKPFASVRLVADLLQLILCFFVQLFQLLVYIDCNFRSHIPIHLILQSVLHTTVSVIRFAV